MEVILLERVAKLGQMGEVVDVKDGYARNFLLPQGKALRVNATNIARFEAEKAQLEAAQPRKPQGSRVARRQARRAGFRRDSLRLRRRCALRLGHHPRRGRSRDRGRLLDRAPQVVLSGPIKELGLHAVRDRTCTPKSSATIKLNVARSAEEAELQASGKSIQELAAEEEAAAEFEIQELFDDIGSAASEDLAE